MNVQNDAVRLLAWSERHRLAERAIDEFGRWLDWQGGTIGGFRRADVRVQLWEQSLVFRPAPGTGPPRVVTRLALSVYEGECPFGTYDLWTDAHGVAVQEVVELGSEVPFEALGGGPWTYAGEMPRGVGAAIRRRTIHPGDAADTTGPT